MVPQLDRVEIVPNGESNQSPPSMPPLADVDRLIHDASKNSVSEHPTNTPFAIHAGDATPQSATEVDFGKDMVECNAQTIVSLTEDEKAEARRAKRRARVAKRGKGFKAARRRAYMANKSQKNSAARDQNEDEAEIEAEEMQAAVLRAYQENEVKVRRRKVRRLKTTSPKFSEDSKRHVSISSYEELAREIVKGGKLNITLSSTLRLKDAERIKKKTHGGNKYKILNRNRLNWAIGK